MIAEIRDNQHIYFTTITVPEEELIDQHFSAENPRSHYIDDLQYQTWDGVYRRFHRGHKRLSRPFLAELRSFCKKSNLPLSVVDNRPPPKYRAKEEDIHEDMLPGISLKEFQVTGVKKVLSTECGIFHITTGGGKTEMMCAIVKSLKCPTVIIAEQTVIIDQIASRLRTRMVCEEPGMFYAGKKPDGQLVIVGTIQSLVAPKKKPEEPNRNKYKDEKGYKRAMKRWETRTKAYKTRKKNSGILRKLIGKCEMVIIDECDLATSGVYKDLFRYWFKGRRRYGFTGTIDPDKPVQKLFLTEHLGSVIYKQSRHDVEAAGLITGDITYNMLAFGDYADKDDARAYDIAMDEDMVYNEQFHRFVNAICDRYPDDGKLILVERDDLGHALCDMIPDAEFYHGKTPKKQRPKILKAFEDREKKVLIGGKNVRRGLDLKGGCEHLIIATGGKLSSEFEQRWGRARRLNASGKAYVWDFYFLTNKYLYGHSRKRLKVVVGMGYKANVIYPDGIIDGEELIRSRFRRPRTLRGRAASS